MKKFKKTFLKHFSSFSDEKQQQAICSQNSLQNGKIEKIKGGHVILNFFTGTLSGCVQCF